MRPLLVALLLLAAAFAQANALDAGKATLDVRIAGSTPKEQTLYLPAADARQSVAWPAGISVQTDEEGNKFITVNGAYDYSFTVTIDASKPDITEDDSFPVKGTSDYTGDTPYIKASDPATKQKAIEATANSHSQLEAIKDLALWVNSYVEYNSSYWGQIYPSTTVLEERKGVCDEYANLYAAMARSLGIPTRIATGIVKSGSEWSNHAWAESRVKGVWVPVDPTYGEVGMISAFHVRLYSAPSYLFYQFPQSLEGRTVEEKSSEQFSTPLVVEGALSKSEVAPRDKFSLDVTVKNNGKDILIPNYFVQKTIGIEMMDDARKTLILHPGDTAAVKWDFVAPFGERDSYFIILNGPGLERTFDVTVNPALTAGAQAAFQITELRAVTGNGSLNVEMAVKNAGNKDAAGVSVSVTTSLGTVQKSIDLRAGDEARVEFSYPLVPGEYDLEGRVELGATKATNFASISVPDDRKEGLFAPITEGLSANLTLMYMLIVAIAIIAIGVVFFVPALEGLKEPFQEKEEWAKLVKLRERKEL
jgi:transglutaminase-like putative cysteine protease